MREIMRLCRLCYASPARVSSFPMLTLAVSNHKGGTGKSTTAHNLGAAMAALARQVLLIDADPQGSLTEMCQVDTSRGAPNLSDVLGDVKPGELAMSDIITQRGPCLWLAPSDIALTVSELGLQTRLGRENVLRRALATVAGRFDLALIDCPPGLGLLALNALVAADAVLIPSQPGGADLRALGIFLHTIDQTKAELNPGLEILGILPTFYDRRLAHHNTALAAMRDNGLPVLPVAIGRSVRIAEAATAGQPLAEYDPSNPQNAAYKQLAEIVDAWLESNRT